MDMFSAPPARTNSAWPSWISCAPSMIRMSFMDGSRAAFTPLASIVPLPLRANGRSHHLRDLVRRLASSVDALDAATAQAFADGRIDRFRGVVLREMFEEHRERADRRDRTRDTFAGVLRRTAVDRLEHRDLARVDVPRRRGTETASERGAQVREDVAEEIRRDDDIELLGLEDHPHRGGVDVHRIAPHIGELFAELVEHVAPDLLDRNGVRLVDERDVLLSVLACELERVADDPLDSRPREAHRDGRDLLRRPNRRSLSLLRVGVLGVLPDDRHVDLFRALSAER